MDDVNICVVDERRRVIAPNYTDEWNEINQQEFTLDVEDVAWFYVADGNSIEIMLYPGYSSSSVELFLNSSIYAAILHQRKILPLHASCFSYDEKNILVCGDSGAGKSSLTVAFCQAGSDFITDDVSPIFFENSLPSVLSLSDRVKLWDDALQQLNIDIRKLGKIQEDIEKFYLPLGTSTRSLFPLHIIFILQVHEAITTVRFEPVKGGEKLSLLRTQIYKPEMLPGMPDNDIIYFQQLTAICNSVTIVKVIRPSNLRIQHLMDEVKCFIDPQCSPLL